MNVNHMQIAAQFTAAITQGMREQANPTSLTHWYNQQQGFNCESNLYQWTAKVGTMVAVVFQSVLDESRATYVGEPLYDIGERLGHWMYRVQKLSDQQIQQKIGQLCWDFFKDSTGTQFHQKIKEELKIQTGLSF